MWHFCTKYKRNAPHKTNNCKSKTATAYNKAKIYVAALTTIDTGSDDKLVVSVDTWGSEIDEPSKKKRNKGKGNPTKKSAKKRKVDIPPALNSDIDTDSLYDVSEIEDSN